MSISFKQPIFYHNGDLSSFLDGLRISPESIVIKTESSLKDGEKLNVEFSFPETQQVLKAEVRILILNKKESVLVIKKMDKNDSDFLINHIKKIKLI